MPVFLIILFLTVLDNYSFAHANSIHQQHIILKNDFNHDGIADRVVFVAKGISGFYQATRANKKVDIFFIQRGNKSISFFGAKDLGGPYIKLVENAGIFSIVSLLKYQDKKFKPINSVVLANKKLYSTKAVACANDLFDTQTKNTANFADAIAKFSTEEILKKSIAENCKTILGNEYQQFENQILSACGVSDGKPEKNDLISCLDKNENTRRFGGIYKTALATSIFEDGFKISCATSNSESPRASFDSASKNISFYKSQNVPSSTNRNYKAEFFHEMSHLGGVTSELLAEDLVEKCILSKNSEASDRLFSQTEIELKTAQERLKDGVKISLPTQEIESTSVATALTESSKSFDNDFSMGNTNQFGSLSRISDSVFKSFEPMMNAAYSAAIPKVFATDSLMSDSGLKTGSSNIGPIGTANTGNRMPAHTAKILDENAKPGNVMRGKSIASANTTNIEPSTASPDPGTDSSQAAPNNRNIASLNETAGATTSSGSGTPSIQTSEANENASGPRLNFASATDPRSQALSKNVPRIAKEEDFIKAITTGKYAEVKARLTDPKNLSIMMEKRIQYLTLDRKKAIGSDKPMIIIKDLGNGFSIQRAEGE